jgi:hypothetical protein
MNMSISNRYKKWSLAVIWIIGISCVVLLGFRDNPYLQHVNGPQAVYPYKQVGQILFLITVQMILYWLILRPTSYRRSWGRALSAFVLSAGVTLWCAMGMMHASPARIAWYYWLIAVTVGMLVLTLWSLIMNWNKD